MWRSILVAIVLLASLAAKPAEAAAERYALVIGNARYDDSVGPLKNPHNDVALIATSLRSIGFDVRLVKDATYRSLDVEIRRHAMKLARAGEGAIGFFYYSGHGVANPQTGANYLIPVDVRSIADRDVWLYAFEQKAVIDKLSSMAGNATNYVVFDACRDELVTPDQDTKSASRSKGFVPIASKAGLLIAYSTAPGKTASDEGRGGGPYARVLAEELVKPGVEAVAMFRAVQLRVRARIKQDPWLSFPALPEIYLAGKAMTRARDREGGNGGVPGEDGRGGGGNAGSPVQAVVPMSAAAKAWLVTQHSNNRAILAAFAAEFPESIFAKFARARIEELDRRKSMQAAAPVAPSGAQLTRALQRELKRLACYGGAIDGEWGTESRLAMVRFNQLARTGFATDAAAAETLEVLKALQGPICPVARTMENRRPEPPPATRRLSGTCQDGNIDHCRAGCRKGKRLACDRLRSMPDAKRYNGGTCRDGNMDVCQQACSQGNPRACRHLRRSAGR